MLTSSNLSEKLRVLVVDRDFGAQSLIYNALKEVCDTEAAFSPRMASVLLDKEAYDLVLPGHQQMMDVLWAERAYPNASAVPVVAITSNGLAAEHACCRAQGFAALMVKPPHPLELRATVLRLVGDHQREAFRRYQKRREAEP